MTEMVTLTGESTAPALVFGDRRVSYAEFRARVDTLARQLISAGVGPDVAVAVCLDRSVELLVAVHAVVAAGGQYVPLDPSAPADRTAHMIDTAAARLLLTGPGPESIDVGPPDAAGARVRVLGVDASGPFDPHTPPVTDADRRAPLHPDDAAYTLFTSGSTGRPKGVTVSHRAIVNRLDWMREWYAIKDSDVFLQKTPVTFDVSVWELFLPFTVGATLVIAAPDRHGEPEYLAGVIVDHRVSVVHFVPSMLAAFTDVLGVHRLAGLSCLRLLFTSGEALTAATAGAVLGARPGLELHNLYGPTEAAVDVTAHRVRPGEMVIPIGVPVPSTSTYVLDARLQLVPVGVPGELYLGGVQLARGYAAQPGLTAERFVADRFGDGGGRLYRTGDLVRWNAGGEIEYLGRTDFQVKLRGQRLELGEVEAVLSAVDGVVHAAVTVARVGGDDHLIAYLAPDEADLDAARAAVAAALPEYMRPTVWMPLTTMPLNAAGKVARRELPAPILGTESDYVAPESDLEAMVAAVVGEVLGIDRVGVRTSFFDLGGNSLSATRVAARLADTLDLDIAVRDLFDTPSVRELVSATVGRGRRIPRLTPASRPERIPLSTAQSRMWFINRFDPDSAAYNIPMALRLTGTLDVAALHDALGDVVERHEVLRTRYPADEQGPFQQILAATDARAMLDWADGCDADALLHAATGGFDVTTELPIRARLAPAGENRWDLVITVHHIAFDGESTPVFVRDLLGAYLARTGADAGAPAPLPVQYADFALWQRSVLGSATDPSARMAAQLEHWRTVLTDLPEVTDLPMDRRRPTVLDTAAGLVTITVDDAVADAVELFAREHDLTAFMVSHAALAITVARLAVTTDVVIGAPIAGRTDAALSDLVGMFVNTLVLRTPVDPAQTLAEFVSTVRAVDVDAFTHSDVQFDDLIDELAPDRSTAHQPLVQIAITHGSADHRSPAPLDASAIGLTAEPLGVAAPVAKFDLTVGVTDRSSDGPMTAGFVYATALFDESTAQRIADTWLRVLLALISAPETATGDVDLLDERALTSMRPGRDSTGGTGPAADGGVSVPRTLVDILAARHTDPDRPALICDGIELSHAEFDRRTQRLARSLIGRGIGPDDVVAVGLERSVDSVIAVFGVIASGAAHVPVDPAYPQDRIDYMLADSGARWGITDAHTRSRLGDTCEWIDVAEATDATRSSLPVEAADRNGTVGLDTLAYLVYTSGSTGRPKAVGVSNRGLGTLVDALAEITGTPDQAPDTRVLHVASPSFDASVLEMMWSVALGHTLVIAPAGEYAGAALGRILERDRVTDTLITPTVLATVDPARGRGIRNLVTGGEACPPELVARWTQARPGGRMFNFYGPSEATVWATTGRSVPGEPVVIGRPVRGFSGYVLDARLHPVPQGVVGELYLGTADSLARGYLGRPGLTASSFVADPFTPAPGGRMYATGDLVRITTSGNIEFAGRADHQVKINGQRVELGEIEAVLAGQAGVESAVVLGVADDAGRTRLVAYLVPDTATDPETGTGLDAEAVLRGAADHLAGHMVPHQAVVLEQLPTTPGGKLDRKALPRPALSAQDTTGEAPATAAEEALAAIVAGLLGRDRVGVTESFFALGGDSIMSIQLASAAKAAGLHLSPREIFEHKTIRGMARVAGDDADRIDPLPEPAGGPIGEMPIPPIVSWLVSAAPTPADLADFNQSMVFTRPAGLGTGELRRVLSTVVAAHPMLSAALQVTDTGPVLTAGLPFDAGTAISTHPVAHAHGVPGPAGASGPDRTAMAEHIREAHAQAARRLDPATGRVVQAALVDDGAGGGRVVLVVHHLAVDAVSWPILVEDLVTAWTQVSAGQEPAVCGEGTSFRAWQHALTGRIEQHRDELGHWLTRGSGDPATGLARSGPADSPTAGHRYRDTDSVVREVTGAVAEAVATAVPTAFGGTVADVLVGALARAIHRRRAERGIDTHVPLTVLLEGHGRYEDLLATGDRPHRADLSRTVGWFTAIAPIALSADGDIVHAIKEAKEERVGMPAHGIGFGLLREDDGSDLGTHRLPDVAVNYLGTRVAAAIDGSVPPADTLPADTLPADTPPTDTPPVGFLPAGDAPFLPSVVDGDLAAMSALTINVGATTGGTHTVSADFRYVPEVLSHSDVADIADRWAEELDAVVRHVTDGGGVGLSPSDVPGTGVTQTDLDDLLDRYRGADVWPLSPLQRGLFFQAELAGDTDVDVYVTQAILELGPEVDLDRLRRAGDDLLIGHRVLRSGYLRLGSGAAVAVVPAQARLPWQTVTVDDAATATGRIAEVAAAERTRPFDLSAPPLMRATAITHPEGVHVVITSHHLLFDGWSAPLVLADLLALYATGATYTRRDTGDFADHLRRLADPDDEAGLAAWRRMLAPVEAPTLVAPGARITADAMPADLVVPIEADLVAAVDRLARAHGATVSTVLQTAWAIFLAEFTGNRVVVFGETVSGRPADLDGVESMVGLFINTLPVVVDVDPDLSISGLLENVQADKVSVLDHQQLGLPEIVAAAGVPVVFDTLTVHESYPVDRDSVTAAAPGTGLTIRGISTRDATHYPLNLASAPAGDALTLTLKYLPSAFDAAQVTVFGGVLRQILRSMATAPAMPVGRIELVAPGARTDAVIAPRLPATTPVTIPDLLAGRTVDAGHPALICDGHVLDHAEFEARTNRVARSLIGRGIGVEDVVAVGIERSVDSVVAAWGVLKSGAAYLPIDPAHPDDRIAFMIGDSRVSTGLTTAATRPRLGESDCRWLELDEVTAHGSPAPIGADERHGQLRVDGLAYLIYTSGTTGRPKAVAVSHRGVATLVAELAALTGDRGAGPDTRVLHVASPGFDASFFEMVWAAAGGHTLVIAPAGDYAGRALGTVLRRDRVTDMVITPSVLATLEVADATGVRLLATAGEACPPDLVTRWAGDGRVMVNLYGPTESTVWSTVAGQTPGAEVTIGRGIRGMATYVLDDRLRPVPRGMVGELYLSSEVSLARGYLNRSALTATRFVADPFAGPGGRMYATGDLVRVRAGGDLEYAGRADHQVKINGQRVELGEIEAVLTGVDGVSAAVVLGVGSPAVALVAHLVAPADLDIGVVRAVAAKRLPAHMVPGAFTILDALPLTPTGKLDRDALPDPLHDGADLPYVAPATPDEEAVAGVFGEVLGVDRVGATASFFDAGGNSLSAARLAARLSDRFDATVTVRDVFDAPTVRLLADLVGSDAKARARAPITAASPRPPEIPLSFAQRRMWFVNRFDPAAATYNIPAVLRVDGRLDIEALRAALVDVVGRHEILRTTFPDVDGVPRQQVHPAADAGRLLDWAVLDSVTRLEAAVTAGFDVTTEFPIRARLCPVPGGAHLIAVVLHHIAADGESVGPLVGDLASAYRSRVEGRAPQWTPLDVQFADFAIWQHRVLGDPADEQSPVGTQLVYWRERLAGLPDVLAVPTDRPRPPVQSHRGATADLVIPAAVAARLTAVAAEHAMTPFMVLHAAVAVLLSRLCATDDIAVATPTAGRGQAVLDPLIGMFVNTLVLRTQVRGSDSFTDLLARVRADDLAAFAHADVPFEALVEAIDPVRSESFSPLAQVMLALDQASATSGAAAVPAVEIAGLHVEPVAAPAVPAQFDLTVSIATAPEGRDWGGSVVYASDLFDPSTIEGFVARFVAGLTDLLADPGAAVGDTSLLLPDESSGLAVWTAGPHEDVAPLLLPDALAAQAMRTPGAAALVSGDRVVGYAEFAARVSAYARALIALGVGPDVAVAVCIPRSVEMVIAVHAVVAAGGQYVPVDVEAPVGRVRSMFETADVRVLLVDRSGRSVSAADVAAESGVPVHTVDAGGPVPAGDGDGSPVVDAERTASLGPDSAAYTLFTSGSTGTPKGVTVGHRAIVNRLVWMQRDHPLTAADAVVQKTPYTFDVSVWELFWPFLIGARLVIAEADRHGDPRYLADLMAARRVSVAHFVPSMLSAFLDVVDAGRFAALDALRLLFTSGEALPPTVAQTTLAALPRTRLHNLYGPTEAAVDVAGHEVTVGETVVPIGRPVLNTTTHVLDARLRPVPPGVAGELYLGGVQVARGYAARPDLTAERFVADPFGVAGSRLYRTGDRVRWDREGRLEYLGRNDFQVKLRGRRLELGEIEAVLSGAPGVVHAAVIVASGPAGDRLVAYLAPAGADVESARALAAGRLPEYMRPDVWTTLPEMPLNVAGKVDRKSLPDVAAEPAAYVAPATEVERMVAQVFAEILDVDRVGATDSFFDLGGNSLAATRVVARAGERYGLRIELPWLFSDPTVGSLARRIADHTVLAGDVLIALRAQGQRPPLFCVHPAGGLAWFYGGLAPYLTDRPIYGLQDPHVILGEPTADAETLARRYVAEIRRVRPHGPYHLLGWSVGGVIAHAMALRLEADHEEVAFLGIMDAAPEADDPGTAGASAVSDAGDAVSGSQDSSVAADLLGGWRDLFDLGDEVRAESTEELTAIIRAQIAGMGLLADDQVERIMESFAASDEAVLGYRPGVFGGGAHVFVATADKEDPVRVVDAWRPYVSGSVRDTEVDTHHLGMADESSLEVIGPVLDEVLTTADRHGSSTWRPVWGGPGFGP
ncbi:amino acid adenylation domain-containing protein [Gordonia sp. NPDC003376]